MDVPNHRSSHVAEVPRGGGIAAIAGAACGSLLTRSPLRTRHAVVILGLATLGWLDDVTGHLDTGVRLVGQLAAGAVLPDESPWPRIVDSILAAGAVNVVNFMDGINGISALTAVVWGVNAMTLGGETRQLETLGALSAGSGLGFLPHNAPAARLFLGDVGSYALGALLAVGVLSQTTVEGRYRVASPLLLYGADAGQALILRAARGHSLSEAHRDHVYQRLVDGGHSHVKVAFAHAAAASAVAGAARLRGPSRAMLTGGVVVGYLGAGFMVQHTRETPPTWIEREKEGS